MNVTVDVDLNQIDTGDLIEELRSRRAFHKEDIKHLDPWALIDQLKELGCPESIIGQLEEWDRLPVVGARELQQWKILCGV